MNERVAYTRAPAKLNLFLELLARRDDGFHEIDTVMVPIDWCDEIRIRRRAETGVGLNVDWLPSRTIRARRLESQRLESQRLESPKPTTQKSAVQKLSANEDAQSVDRLLSVPTDGANLVSRALHRLTETFGLEGGFDCELLKSVPAGAGMGGASSDAAAALRCAAELCGIQVGSPELANIAAEIGSDVPFFLGLAGESISAARATGRGERLESVRMRSPLDLVVAYPSVSLSTAKVYAASQVPVYQFDGIEFVAALAGGDHRAIGLGMMNRLSEPARILAPQIDEILESMWRAGVRTCQLTGSGSACFALVRSAGEARRMATRLQSMLAPGRAQGCGAIVVAVRTTRVPSPVKIQSTTWARRRVAEQSA